MPTVLPIIVQRLLLVFSWSAIPFWGASVAGIFIPLPVRCLVVSTGAAMMATTCWLVRGLAAAAERNAQRRLDIMKEQQQVLVLGIDRLASVPTRPQPALKVVKDAR